MAGETSGLGCRAALGACGAGGREHAASVPVRLSPLAPCLMSSSSTWGCSAAVVLPPLPPALLVLRAGRV